jgi:hypothetical protein
MPPPRCDGSPIITTPALTPRQVVTSHWRTGGPIGLADGTKGRSDHSHITGSRAVATCRIACRRADLIPTRCGALPSTPPGTCRAAMALSVTALLLRCSAAGADRQRVAFDGGSSSAPVARAGSLSQASSRASSGRAGVEDRHAYCGCRTRLAGYVGRRRRKSRLRGDDGERGATDDRGVITTLVARPEPLPAGSLGPAPDRSRTR